jgi:hypothetical protein
MFPMQIFYIIAVLVVVGLALWFLGQIPAIDATMKQLIRAVLIIFAVLFCLYEVFGMFSGGGGFHSFAGPCH